MNSEDKKYLQLAIEQAKKSIRAGGFPAGAIIVKEGKIIAEGISIGNKLNDPTGHAETSSIRSACQKMRTTNLRTATLYGSLQPCLMCFSVANWAGVSRTVFASNKTEEMISKGYYEGNTDIDVVNKQNNRKMEILFIPDFEEESLTLVRQWEG